MITLERVPIVFEPDLGYEGTELYIVKIISLEDLIDGLQSGKYELI